MPFPTEFTLKGSDTPAGERFNYTGMHRYLLTLPAHGPGPTFTSREIANTILNALREASWHHHFDVYAYSFLPDRLLLIVRGKEATSQMKMFLREFRTSSDGALAPALGHSLWSKKYLERVLRKTEITSEAARELFTAPVKLGLAPSPREYPLQGSFVRDPAFLFGSAEGPPRSSGPRSSGPRSSGPRSSGPRTSGPRPTGFRPSGSRPTGFRPSGSRPTGPRPTGSRPTGPRPKGPRPTGPRPKGPPRSGRPS